MPRRTNTVPITLNIDVELKDWLYREAAKRDLVPARCMEAALEAWRDVLISSEEALRKLGKGARE